MDHAATTILKQLGGSRFIAMTGAKNFVSSGASLKFNIPRTNGFDTVEIVLEPSDTYRVTFGKWNRKQLALDNVTICNGVYHDGLRETFETHTGLRTSL